MVKHRSLFLLVLGSILLLLLLCSHYVSAIKTVELMVMNQAGDPVELFWIDDSVRGPQQLVKQSERPIRNNSEIAIDSYPMHQFSIRWHKHLPGTEVNFTVDSTYQTIIVRYDPDADGLYIELEDETTEMKKTVKSVVHSCQHLQSKSVGAYKHCITEKMVEEAQRTMEATKRMDGFRSQMAERLRNYTCADDDLQTTEAVRNYTYHHLDKSYLVKVLLDEENSKVWMIEDFATEEECEMLMESARPNLRRAQVHGDDGLEAYSESRRAQQADYIFHQELRKDKIWPLFDRTIRAVNFHGRFSLHPEGQEGFSIIQYNPGDEYTSHCDGTCDGSYFLPKSRVATSILYCKTSTLGGGTYFPNADIFVKPKRLAALMFSYKGRKGVFDDELTLHSGCPVREGEKWITTSWLREGVSERFPHHYYDANGVPVLYTDEGDYVEEEAIDKEGEDYEAYEEEEAYIDLAGEL